MPGGGFAELSPVEELRLFRFDRALGTIRRFEPTNREVTFMAARNQPPSEEWTRKLENEAAAVLLRQQSGAPPPARPGVSTLGPVQPSGAAPSTVVPPAAPSGPLRFFDWDAASSGVRAGGTPYATLGGTVRDLTGWHTEPFAYTKRDPAATEVLRSQFSGFARADFCENLALQHRPAMEAAGFTAPEIELLAHGRPPPGYEVHHLRPLDGGGTNAMDNLVLIRTNPEHRLVTAYQAAARRGMQPGDTRLVQWPMPPAGTLVWPPRQDRPAP